MSLLLHSLYIYIIQHNCVKEAGAAFLASSQLSIKDSENSLVHCIIRGPNDSLDHLISCMACASQYLSIATGLIWPFAPIYIALQILYALFTSDKLGFS